MTQHKTSALEIPAYPGRKIDWPCSPGPQIPTLTQLRNFCMDSHTETKPIPTIRGHLRSLGQRTTTYLDIYSLPSKIPSSSSTRPDSVQHQTAHFLKLSVSGGEGVRSEGCTDKGWGRGVGGLVKQPGQNRALFLKRLMEHCYCSRKLVRRD